MQYIEKMLRFFLEQKIEKILLNNNKPNHELNTYIEDTFILE